VSTDRRLRYEPPARRDKMPSGDWPKTAQLLTNWRGAYGEFSDAELLYNTL